MEGPLASLLLAPDATGAPPAAVCAPLPSLLATAPALAAAGNAVLTPCCSGLLPLSAGALGDGGHITGTAAGMGSGMVTDLLLLL
jgi:hypothetical protein